MRRFLNRGLKSYVSGTYHKPLTNRTIPEQVRLITEQYSTKTAVHEVIKKRKFSYEDLERDTNNMAGNLISLGLKKGDRIGIYSVNHYEWIVAQLAAAKAGLIMVCINPAYKPREMNYALNKVALKAIVSDTVYGRLNFADTVNEALGQPHSLEHVIFMNTNFDKQNLSNFDGINVSTINDLLTEAESGNLADMETIIANQDADEACNIQFTSGTTGDPKGATLTHHNLLNCNRYAMSDIYSNVTSESKLLMIVPLYHSSGCAACTMSMINNGLELLVPSPHFDAQLALKTMHDHKGTIIIGVPTMYLDMLTNVTNGVGKFGDQEIYGYMGGAMCPTALRHDLAYHVPNLKIAIVYGTTENSPVTFGTPKTASKRIFEETVGYVLPFTESKIVNVETNQIVPRGTIGEICTRGYCVFKGYWDDEIKTKETVDDNGWYYSGDLGYFTDDGGLVVTGRAKEMIIRSGENIYPAEIENIMLKIEEIEDVHVVGVPNKRTGEEVAAYIKVKTDISDEKIYRFLKEELTYFKIPKYIQRVEDFPMTATGKVQKFKLAERAINDFSIQVD